MTSVHFLLIISQVILYANTILFSLSLFPSPFFPISPSFGHIVLNFFVWGPYLRVFRLCFCLYAQELLMLCSGDNMRCPGSKPGWLPAKPMSSSLCYHSGIFTFLLLYLNILITRLFFYSIFLQLQRCSRVLVIQCTATFTKAHFWLPMTTSPLLPPKPHTHPASLPLWQIFFCFLYFLCFPSLFVCLFLACTLSFLHSFFFFFTFIFFISLS